MERGYAYITLGIALLLAHGDASAHTSWADLGSYERQALAEISGGRPYDFEPDPEGKRIASVTVRNLNVFRKGTALAWANALRMVSREHSVRQELTFKVGDPFVWTNIQQSLRLLRNPFYSSLVVIVPLRSKEQDAVDILVVTRDRWSIRTNAEFEIQAGKITNLEALPADNNFLGLRKRLAIEVLADQGEYSVGPRYIDPNLTGRRWRLDTGAALIFNRSSDSLEGAKFDALVELPLYRLDPRWGFSALVDARSSVFREFEDESVRLYQDSVTGSEFPFEYRLRTSMFSAEAVRQWGKVGIHRFAAGYRLASKRPATRSSFGGTLEELERFESAVLPRSERTSGLFARFESFKPRFVFYRNIDSYDLPEEEQTGPRANVELSTSTTMLWATAAFANLSATIGWWVDFKGQAYMDAQMAVTTRFGGDALEDNGFSASIKLATAPFAKGLIRVVSRGEIALRLNDEENIRFAAGGDTGLRGFPVGQFLGRARALGNVEVRSKPFQVWFTRAGVLAFWDSGHAAATFGRIRLHNDVGVGVRMLIPQFSSELFRIDWAFPLDGNNVGWPGRLTAGFRHVF